MRLLAILVFFCAASIGRGATVVNQDMTVNTGDVYGALEVHDGAQGQTTLQMNGGIIEDILSLDSCKIQIAGGFVTDMAMRDLSSARLQGGEVNSLSLRDGAHVNMSGGRVFLVFDMADGATAHVEGGVVEAGMVGLAGSSSLDADGGRWEGLLYTTEDSTLLLNNLQTSNGISLWATDRSHVEIMASGAHYDPSSLILTGNWLNGQSFSLQYHDAQTADHINIVPEPSMLLGMLVVMGCRAKNNARARSFQPESARPVGQAACRAWLRPAFHYPVWRSPNAS